MKHRSVFSVEGLMCGSCLVEVLERLHRLEGVIEASMGLDVGGRSPVLVRSDRAIPAAVLAAVVADAGFRAWPGDAATPSPTRARGPAGPDAVPLQRMAGVRS